MASILLTTKTGVSGGIASGTLPSSEFSSNSTSYVDVTGAVFATIPVGAYYKAGANIKYIGGNSGNEFAITDSADVALYETTNSSTSFTAKTTGVLQNLTGSTLSIKLRIKTNSGGNSSVIQVDSFWCHYGDQRNITDDNKKMYVTQIVMFGSTEGTLGISGVSDALTTINLNAMLDAGIVWSANSGNMIYTWTGKEIGVQA